MKYTIALHPTDGVLSGERGQYRFGDQFGGTILRGRSIKFQVPLETQFSFIHNGTSTLIDPSNTNTSATGASTLTVIGNTSIGASNIAAPSNGLAVSGRTLIGTSTNNTTDQLQVSGSSLFTGNQRIVGNQITTGSLLVSGSETLIGNKIITGSLTIASGSGDLYVNGNKLLNYGSFYSTGSITTTANVSQSFALESSYEQNGISIVSGSRITHANSGTYNIHFSAQIYQTGGDSTLYIWFKKNGINIPNSGTQLTTKANIYHVASWNFLSSLAANDYIELVYQSDSSNTQFPYIAATGNIPAVPPIIITSTQVR